MQPEVQFWAKTTPDGEPGISVHDHCLKVGCVAEALLATLPPPIKALLPSGSATLAALHDVGKITIGFQAKCLAWLKSSARPLCSDGKIALSVADHALVSQRFLQQLPAFAANRLWAVAVGAHHGRPKGRKVDPANPFEALREEWAQGHRENLLLQLESVFGAFPTTPPDPRLYPHHSDLWLLAGLVTVADWIGSNETWFSPQTVLSQTRPAGRQAKRSVRLAGRWQTATDRIFRRVRLATGQNLYSQSASTGRRRGLAHTRRHHRRRSNGLRQDRGRALRGAATHCGQPTARPLFRLAHPGHQLPDSPAH